MRWIWLVLLCACGDNIVPRLVALTYDVGGVTYTRPGQFHDTLRDEDCHPDHWADGATYCTPPYDDAPVYTDAGCTDAIAVGSGGYTATYFTLAGIKSLRRLRPVTPSMRNPAQYWMQSTNGCDGPFPAPAGISWGEIGDELDESAFVRLLRSAPEGDGRVQTIVWHTSDGLRQPTGFHDRELGVDCTVTTEFGRDHDHVVCAPPAQPLYYYADAACTQPVVVASPDDPLPILELDCETFARAGAERMGALYASSGGLCQPTTAPDGFRHFEVGAPVEAPVLSRVRGGSGRIQSITLVAGNVHVPDRYLHDTMIDADCEPVRTTDGPRCLPTWQNIDTYYSDDQCTQTVEIVSENVGTCAAPVQYGRDPDGFHEVGAIVTDPLYVPSTGDICMVQPPSGEPHEVGPPLPLDTFVPAL